MKKFLTMAAAIALAALFSPAAAQDESAKKEGDMPNLTPRVVVETTMGNFTLELDAQKAPITVNNFIQYARDDFYDGTIFHRVMDGFMIQGGGFDTNLDKKEEGMREPIKNEWKNGLSNKEYTIAMARLGNQPDSATAQFFVNVADNDFLDQPRDGAGYAVFGKVVEGKDVVDKIKTTETIEHAKYPGGKVVPKEAVVINDVRVVGEYDMEAVAAAAGINEKSPSNAAVKLAPGMPSPEDYMAQVSEEKGKEFTKTDSGLFIMTLEEGGADGAKPAPTDRVQVHYKGMFLDGREFDSSYSRGKPTTFGLNQVIRGWTEGVGMMKEGEKALLVIPPDLGYGKRGAGNAIPPDTWLAFEIELLKVM